MRQDEAVVPALWWFEVPEHFSAQRAPEADYEGPDCRVSEVFVQAAHSGDPSSQRRATAFLQDCDMRTLWPILVVDSYDTYEPYSAMTRVNVSKAREEFPDLVNRAAYGKERTIVSRRGKDLAAVIPIEDLRLLERLTREEMDRIDLEDAQAALKEAEEKGTVPLRDLMRELGD